jgi:hypothetical protein
MTFCDFSSLVCPHCGFDIRQIPHGDERSIRQCESAGAAPAPPSFARQAWNYLAATAKWAAAGRPTRSDAEVGRVLAICQACPNFRPIAAGDGQCLLCGCGCSADSSALANKLRMATEHCPDEPARW